MVLVNYQNESIAESKSPFHFNIFQILFTPLLWLLCVNEIKNENSRYGFRILHDASSNADVILNGSKAPYFWTIYFLFSLLNVVGIFDLFFVTYHNLFINNGIKKFQSYFLLTLAAVCSVHNKYHKFCVRIRLVLKFITMAILVNLSGFFIRFECT